MFQRDHDHLGRRGARLSRRRFLAASGAALSTAWAVPDDRSRFGAGCGWHGRAEQPDRRGNDRFGTAGDRAQSAGLRAGGGRSSGRIV